jgi:pyruvate-ferredoxin/flavodoxin oxidoreductase
MVMQSAFFKLANIIPIDQAMEYLKNSVEKSYGKKGQNIVDANKAAIDRGATAAHKVTIPSGWANAEDNLTEKKQLPEFITKIERPMARHEGDELPVSAFNGMEDGTFPLGITAYEKRGIAVRVPEWQIDKCIQCNQCSLVCPHAVIRACLLTDEEKEKAPETFYTKTPMGKGGFEKLHYRIQISPLDCTGCGNCADICPAPGKALIMKSAEEQIKEQAENFEYAIKVIPKEGLMDLHSLKGSQFARPLLEFNGACPGCGETPYIKLLTQLYGDRMMIANATGCSSIWGGSAPATAYTTNDFGKGPSWGNSLFEDNAEYGYGMFLAVKQMREKLADLMREAVNMNINPGLKEAFNEWLNGIEDPAISKSATCKILDLLAKENLNDNKTLKDIMDRKDYLIKKSHWLLGGDGWAYDIGYGGLDHVLSLGDDINIFVMDTEIYSNTGGQSSKSTPTGAIAKFAAGGKGMRKKDLGLMAMSYGHVYVTQIAMGANMNQTVKAISEAEAYKGTSLIIAYAPCISHGIKTGMGTSMAEEKKAVEAGYWQLYRYNPLLKIQGKNPFVLDSKEPKTSYQEFINGEIRYSSLKNVFPDRVEEMFKLSEEHARDRYDFYRRLAEMEY